MCVWLPDPQTIQNLQDSMVSITRIRVVGHMNVPNMQSSLMPCDRLVPDPKTGRLFGPSSITFGLLPLWLLIDTGPLSFWRGKAPLCALFIRFLFFFLLLSLHCPTLAVWLFCTVSFFLMQWLAPFVQKNKITKTAHVSCDYLQPRK